MPDNTSPEAWPLPELTRARRAIVVVDVVESVRLMQEDEAGFIDRWRRFVHEVRTEVLPKFGGRMVKSLGDGMLLTFETAPKAVAAAFAMQALACHSYKESQASTLVWPMQLRVGVHDGPVVQDELDVYGAGVNLAARVAALAQPCGIVVSASVRDQLIVGLDADIEDLGECYLKNIQAPVRAFRLLQRGSAVVQLVPDQSAAPRIAVLPLHMLHADAASRAVAQVFADDLVCVMARTSAWRVLSPLSTAGLADRPLDTPQLSALTGAEYVVSGSVVAAGDQVQLRLHLSQTSTGDVIWSRVATTPASQILSADDRLGVELCTEMLSAMLGMELRLARASALPNLRGYTLLLHAVALMHKGTQDESSKAQTALAHLIERHPRAADAHAWLAKWHFLQLPLLQSKDRLLDVAKARAAIHRSLEIESNNGLASALNGHLMLYVDGQLDDGLGEIERALADNPNEALAWLFKANALTMLERGAEAVDAIERARALSPLDPIAYFYNMFAAAAYRVAGRSPEAVAFAQRSLRENRLHLPSLVELILAQVQAGDMDAARAAADNYLALRPQASVARFVGFHPARGRHRAEQEAQALIAAGLPA